MSRRRWVFDRIESVQVFSNSLISAIVAEIRNGSVGFGVIDGVKSWAIHPKFQSIHVFRKQNGAAEPHLMPPNVGSSGSASAARS